MGLAATALGAVLPQVPPQDSGFGDLLEMVQAAAWGAANERKFGAANLDAQQALDAFQ